MIINLCAVKINNKWGFINDSGKLMIPLIFDQVERFDNEYHNVVKKNKMYLSCNTDNNFIYPKYNQLLSH